MDAAPEIDNMAPAPPIPASAPGRRRRRLNGKALSALFTLLALLGILLVGAAFRLTDLHWDKEAGKPILVPWDEGLALHPDERFLTMVAMAIQFPEPCRGFIPRLDGPPGAPPPPERDLRACFAAYLDTAHSTLNPRNVGHGLWVYGSLPMIMFRALLDALHITDFTRVTEAGRVVSALADLLTVVVTFFLGKRLLGTRGGLLAALFLSLSVLNIQNAHFFTVDIITALEVLLCVYLAVVIAEGRGGWGTFVLLGIVFGLAVASKINVATFALIIAMAGTLRVWRRVQEKGDAALWPELTRTALALFLAAALAVAVFRLAQPDAFTGPGLFDVKLEERYRSNLETVQGLVSGQVDYYPSHQWTNRTALVFPWTNMVVWGLGLPLGLAAWAGVVWAGWRLVRRRDLRMVVPLAWTLLLFIYQGIQFVKTMRYFLPIYPLLCIFAAYLLLSVWDWARGPAGATGASPLQGSDDARGKGRFPWRTSLAGALLAVVVLGTLAWAWGFIQIYRRPITRAAASRWIYQNIPTDRGAWLTMVDGSKTYIGIPNGQTYSTSSPASTTSFSVLTPSLAIQLTIAHLEDITGQQGEEEIVAALCGDAQCQEVLGRGTIRGDFSGPAGDGAPGIAPLNAVPLEPGRTYFLRLNGRLGMVRTWAVALANEAWDDAVPMRVDGKDGFSIYRGLTLQPYAEDTPQKVDELLHQLANADYVCLTSNRLYDSIPRLPMRYPVTTRYYRALFDGSLGYERVATFTSFPTLFAWSVPEGIAALSDEERTAQGLNGGGLVLPDQGAEEAFSVYDHPVVQIFRRTAAFDIVKARALLTDGIEWDEIDRIRPIEVPRYRDLLLTEPEKAAQRQGGTWSEIFPTSGWPTKVALPLWLLLIEALGLAVWPLAHFLLGKLSDGGFLPAKALGLLLLGYLSWLPAATRVVPYTRWTILGVLLLLLVLGGAAGWLRRKELLELWRTRRKLLLLEEGLFLAGFLLFLLIRFGNPDLWHPWFGGEKPMDLAYLNAIIRSTTFPPYDPWYAGGYLNYYYFGWVILAAPIKLTGIVPAVAYNLALPTLYGMVGGGAFTVVYHLVGRGKREGDGWEKGPILAGLAGAAFVALLGNLGQFMLIVNKLGEVSQLSFESNIPGLAGLVKGVAGLFKVLQGKPLPIGLGSWYWDASRVIVQHAGGPPRGNEINEFPFFTFLYADLHPHMIAMPFTLLLMTQVVALVQDRERQDRSIWSLLPPPWAFLGISLVLGVLRAGNFWDFVTYFLVTLGGWAVALYQWRRRIGGELLLGVGMLGALLYLLSSFLLAPFWARYGMLYNSVTLWTGERTRVGEFIVINGLALFVLVTYLLVETLGRGAREGPLHLAGLALRHWERLPELWRRLRQAGALARQRSPRRRFTQSRALPLLLWSLAALLLVTLFFFLPAKASTATPSLLQHLRGQPLVGWLVLLIVPGTVLLFRRRAEAEERIIALLTLAGLSLAAGVELVVVKGDIARQNTFFKFYMQIWIMWGVAAAAMLPRLWRRMQSWSSGARRRWWAVLYILIGLGALYPLLAAPAKVRDRFPNNTAGPSLDGEAFMRSETYPDEHGPIVLAEDAAAIDWLRANVSGSPVVLEAASGLYNVGLYRWGSRISIHTGLPTVLGWDWHQTQQRGGESIQTRLREVAELYTTTDVNRTLALLRKYEVSYIVVGQVERYYYPSAAGLDKFAAMVGTYLEQVYPAADDQTKAAGSPEAVPAAGGPGGYPAPAAAPVYPGPQSPPVSLSATTATPPSGTVIYRVRAPAGGP